jgi:hypothetical protein
MDPAITGLFIPLLSFAAIILISALVSVSKVHDLETEVRQRLYVEELEHRHRMKELDLEMERLKRDTGGI